MHKHAAGNMKPQLAMACRQMALCLGEGRVHDKVRRWRLFRLAPRVHPVPSVHPTARAKLPSTHLPPSSLHILREHRLPLFCYSLHHFCARLLHTLISVCLCFPTSPSAHQPQVLESCRGFVSTIPIHPQCLPGAYSTVTCDCDHAHLLSCTYFLPTIAPLPHQSTHPTSSPRLAI